MSDRGESAAPTTTQTTAATIRITKKSRGGKSVGAERARVEALAEAQVAAETSIAVET